MANRFIETSSSSKPVTQADIAAIVGCSQNTVTLALRNSPRISESRRQRILSVAQKLGYRPSIAARGLRRGRSGLIGLYGVIDAVRSDFINKLMRALHDTEYKPVLGIDYDNVKPWHDGTWIQTLLSMQVEAMVSFAWNDLPHVPPWVERVPLIFAGFQSGLKTRCDMVAMDRKAAVEMAVEYLISQGHRRIAMVQGHYGWYVTDGFVESMKKRGMEPMLFSGDGVSATQELFAQLRAVLRNKATAPTGIFVLNTSLAVELFLTAQRNNWQDVLKLGMVGYDRAPWLDRLPVPIATIEQPMKELVDATLGMVLERLENPGGPKKLVTLPFHLVVRK